MTSRRLQNVLAQIQGIILAFFICGAALAGWFLVRLHDVYAHKSELLAESLADSLLTKEVQILEDAKKMLKTFEYTPDVVDARQPSCDKIMSSILGENDTYVEFGVTDPRGNVMCGAPQPYAGASIGGREFFRHALEMHALSVGGFQSGRLMQKPGVTIGNPVYGGNGQLKSVLLASVSLGNFSDLFSSAVLPQDSILGFVDRNGIALSWYPHNEIFVGKKVEDAMIGPYVTGNFSGSRMLQQSDGKEMFYSFRPVFLDNQRVGTLIVGVPKQAFFKESLLDFEVVIVGSGALLVLALLVIWRINGLFGGLRMADEP